MKPNCLLLLCFLYLMLMASQRLGAQIETYPWPAGAELIDDSKYEIRARTYDRNTQAFGSWVDMTVFLSYQRSYPDHWKVGGDAGTDFMNDRSLSFASFAFRGAVEIEVSQRYSAQKAQRVEIAPQGFGVSPHYFDGTTVRFVLYEPRYVSVHFDFGSNDQTLNRDSNRANGFDILHGCMILTDIPEQDVQEYSVPDTNSPGVVVWNNQTDLSVIRNADIIFFPPGEHEMRYHKDRWELNSSWDQADAAGNWVTTQTEYENAPLYRGRLFLGKDGQRVYLAPGAIVYGGFHNHGHDNNWLYGRGIVTGRKHLMHEIIKPNSTIPINDPYIQVTQTKAAFVHYGLGAVYDGPIFLEAWHHTCPSGQNSRIRRIKIIGWCSNNDGIRPGSGSVVNNIFIKTSDDYDYARDVHTVTNAVIWPMVNGAVGQMGWSNLGNGYAEYYNMHVIHAEWHLGDFSKTNVGVLCGGKADAGIKLEKNILSDIQLEDPTNYLIGVALEGNSVATGYLKDFSFRNITTEYPFQNPAGIPTQQELRGKNNSWVENWRFTNLFVDGVLVKWENYQDYFNLNLIGTNGNNIDQAARTKNLLFDTFGSIFTIDYMHTAGGTIRPGGRNGSIQIAQGMDQVVHILPDDGYRIKSITVDGSLKYQYGNNARQERRPNWRFENVQANHTVEVVFEPGDDHFDLSNPGLLSGLEDLPIEKLRLYPNPTDEFVFLELPEADSFQLWVYDILGRLVREEKSRGNLHQLSLAGLVPGTYRVVLLQEEKKFRGTVIVR